jgi:hypothetical protein
MLIKTLIFLSFFANFFLYYRIIKKKNYFCFYETAITIYTLSYGLYYLIKYRTHHSYQNINEFFLTQAYIQFLVFLFILYIVYLLKDRVSFAFNLKIFKNIKKIIDNSLTKKKETELFIILSLIGFFFFLINRTNILTCSNNFTGYIGEYINSKLITLSYFGIYLYFSGILFILYKITISQQLNKKIIFFFYLFILPITFLITINQNGGSGLIVILFIIGTILLLLNNKNLLRFYFVYFIFIIFITLSTKNIIRENISAQINDCQKNIIKNSMVILKVSSNFINNEYSIFSKESKSNKLSYMNEKGDLVEIDNATRLRVRFSNIVERIDLLQMLAQNFFLLENKYLKFSNGETYFNRNINWKTEYGIRLKQIYNETTMTSAFNMPALNEAFFNFGTLGVVIFSVFYSMQLLFVNFLLNKTKISISSKIIILLIFSPMLVPDNDLIFYIKNMIYIGVTFLIFILLITTINSICKNLKKIIV